MNLPIFRPDPSTALGLEGKVMEEGSFFHSTRRGDSGLSTRGSG
jgi:hypothetical protein